ncbi:MAG: glycine--tRNA ligase subunit alpha [Pseudonocardiaceae bacterium]
MNRATRRPGACPARSSVSGWIWTSPLTSCMVRSEPDRTMHDVADHRALLETYAAEAQRMINPRLPVPAYSSVLKCSHAFSVPDRW